MGISRNLSWSITRSKTLAECPRRFFFEYFADGEAEAYAAWNLKELLTPAMLAGEVVDLVIAAALKRIAKGEQPPMEMGNVAASTFRKFVKQSPQVVAAMRLKARTAKERTSSPYRPLQSDWYGLDLGEEYFMRLESQVRDCLSTFEASEVLERIRSTNPQNWGPFTRSMRTRPFFEMEGYRIYTSFDFYFREGDELYLLDWKSGSESPTLREAAKGQLAVYALFAHRTFDLSPERIHTQAVWLRDHANWDPIEISQGELAVAEARITAEVRREHELLEVRHVDAEAVEFHADRSQFLPKPSVNKCAQCKFREICPAGETACGHIIASAKRSDDRARANVRCPD